MSFEVTDYFKYTKNRSDRKDIKDKWILKVIDEPIKIIKQSDGRYKKWAYIDEVDRYLRVILLEDDKTVHNAFFDRRFKEN
jgi:hypothetical protein